MFIFIPRRYLRIVHGCSTLNRSDLSENCTRLIRDLLRLNTEQRLGCGPRAALDVLEHPWFASMNFWHLYRQNYIAPYLPTRKSLLAAPEATDAVLRFTAKNPYEEKFHDFWELYSHRLDEEIISEVHTGISDGRRERIEIYFSARI